LQSLAAGEMFFFLDEWGPVQVRKRGGKTYRTDHATILRRQVSRGNVSPIAALSATTNQVTWYFLESKDSHAMIAGELKHCFVPCYYPGAALRQSSTDISHADALRMKDGHAKPL
jgi:hypothetical protein